VQGPGYIAAEELLVDAEEQGAQPQAFFHVGLEVAGLVQFGVQPAGLEGLGEGRQLVLGAPGGEGLNGRLGREHAGLHGGVGTLDAGCVEEARVVADQRAAREDQLGLALQATGSNGPGAVGEALAALQEFAYLRVSLVALELLEGRQVGIGVVETDDVADRHQIVFQVVAETAAVGGRIHGPAGGVHHQALDVLCRRDLPTVP
jgi:hypothetical protein